MRVLHVVDTLGMGGGETWLMAVLRRWDADRIGVMDFLATSGNRGVYDEEAESLGAKIHYIPYTRRNVLGFAREFRAVLRSPYDVLHDHQGFASGWHYAIGSNTLPRVRVTHVHNASYQIQNDYGITASRRLATNVGRRLVAGLATHIAGTSRQVLSEYGFNDPMFRHLRKEVVHCGFDVRRLRVDRDHARRTTRNEFGWPSDTRIVLFAGRLDPTAEVGHSTNQKNVGFAVRSCLTVARADARLRVLIAGETSPAQPALESLIRDAGLDDRFRFIGVRRDLHVLMAAADALIFPSRAEGLGMVAVEAQASGLPVLASDTVPRECVVVPGLVQFRSLAEGPDAWSVTLAGLIANERSQDDLDRANDRVRSSPFSIESSVTALAALYGPAARP